MKEDEGEEVELREKRKETTGELGLVGKKEITEMAGKAVRKDKRKAL